MLQVAILYEDSNPVRAFDGDSCIYRAFKYAHKHYYLANEGYPIHKLPEWLEVKYYTMTEEQFKELIK